jgi:hypothetical protein
MESDVLFEVSTPLGFLVHVTRGYREFIATVKHPAMRESATEVQNVLQTPDEVRQSRSDPAVFLFYRAELPGRWLYAVAKRLNEVRRSAMAAVAVAERLASSFSPSSPQRLPRLGHVRFHLRTRGALLVSAELGEEDLGEGEHSLSELFYAIHEVIRRLRMVSESLSSGG